MKKSLGISCISSRQKQKMSIHLLLFTFTEISSSYVITLGLHFYVANADLFQEKYP